MAAFTWFFYDKCSSGVVTPLAIVFVYVYVNWKYYDRTYNSSALRRCLCVICVSLVM